MKYNYDFKWFSQGNSHILSLFCVFYLALCRAQLLSPKIKDALGYDSLHERQEYNNISKHSITTTPCSEGQGDLHMR